ncbi:MAG: 50S ribosomal protein L25/general stress protein Ctc [Gammaproteobacteria bacterium]|nr:50S ribosomal protein L25/general stress protein Ctc [Gammaproteobacteria bacterium]
MKDNFDLIAEFREDQGKGASRRLRHKGKVPAIIYGAGRPPRSLTFDQNKVLKRLEDESFYSSVLNIRVGEKSQSAIVKDLQRHPAKHIIMHIDFQRIVDDEEIKMNIPLHFLGEDVAPGVKEGGSVAHLINDVEISCLPKDLPEYLEVDVSELELDKMLHLSDIKLPKGVEILNLVPGEENDQGIVSIQVIKAAPIEDDISIEAEDSDGGDAGVEDNQTNESTSNEESKKD